jgi:hypothetical protein
LSKGSVDRSRRFSCLVGGMSSRRPAAQRAQPQPRAELRFCGMRLALEAPAPARAAAWPLVAPINEEGGLTAEERAEAVRGMLVGTLNLGSVPEAARDDLEVVLAWLSAHPSYMGDVSNGLLYHHAVMLTALNMDGMVLFYLLQHANDGWVPERALVLAAVAQDGRALQYAEELQGDLYVVLAAVQQNGMALEHADWFWQQNREVVLAAVASNGLALWSAAPPLREDRAVVLVAVRNRGLALAHASYPLRDDSAVVLAAVRQDGMALFHASETLKEDRDIVLAAVAQNGEALEYASETLQADHEVVLNTLGPYGFALAHASPDLLDDEAFMMAAVAKYPFALRAASFRLRDNIAVVGVAAVQGNAGMLAFASVDLRKHKGLVLAALSHVDPIVYGADADGLQHASAKLQADPEVVLAAVLAWGGALQHASETLQRNKPIVLAAVAQDGMALEYASETLQGNKPIVLAAVAQDGLALEYASETLQGDPEVVLAAVTQNGVALKHASYILWHDIDLVVAAAATSGYHAVTLASYADLDVRTDFDVLLVAAGAEHGEVLRNGADNYWSDDVVVERGGDADAREDARARVLQLTLAAVAANGRELQYASVRMRDNREVVLAAVSGAGEMLEYASPDLQDDSEVVLTAISQRFLTLEQLADPALAAAAAYASVHVLQYAGAAVQADPTLALAAVELDAGALKYFAPALWREREPVLEAVLRQEVLKVEPTNRWDVQHAPRLPRALDTYPLSSCGWETDPFLQEITAYPKRALAAFDGVAGAHRRMALSSLDLPALAAPARRPPAVSYDLLELLAAYTSRAGVDRRFRERAGGEGGFLDQGEWTGQRPVYDHVVPPVVLVR